MHIIIKKSIWIILFSTWLIAYATASERLIIKYKSDLSPQPLNAMRLNALSQLSGGAVSEIYTLATGAHVLELKTTLNATQLKQIISQLRYLPEVSYVEPDLKLHALTTRPLPEANPWQWNLHYDYPNATANWRGDNFLDAFDQLNSHGYLPGESVTIAVIDTGYTPHTSFESQLQALAPDSKLYGYQFISDCYMAGKCPRNKEEYLPPQPDAADLGDSAFFLFTSSWHGSHVMGIIAGQGYHQESGILGGAYKAKIVPVRVLGKGGGYTSDVLAGMLWGAGLDAERPNNYPAQILSMSLGSDDSCSAAMQDTINLINTQAQSIIVVAAGNSSEDIKDSNPAGCAGVISVAAAGPTNALAYYSNYGKTTISASGGDDKAAKCSENKRLCQGAILSSIWNSPYSFNYADGESYVTYEGTSMAAPQAAAAIADMISVLKHQQQQYNLESIVSLLQQNANYDYTACLNQASLNHSPKCASGGRLDLGHTISSMLKPSR